jgi:glycosyltransferase involved in cell wall biosynthesis
VRIALISETWLPSVDGVVTRLRHTVRHLRDAGHQVLVLAPSVGRSIRGVQQLRLRGVVLPFIDEKRRVGIPQSGQVRTALRQFQPDVVHVVNPVLLGWTVLRTIGDEYPTVVSFHTDLEQYVAAYHLGGLRRPLHALMRAAYGSAQLALATSPTGVERLAAVGVRAELWPPGVDVELFRGRRRVSPAPAWLSSEPELPTALCVGRLAPEKRWGELAPVVALARQSAQPWHLTFVGDGPARADLVRAFGHLPVTFTGVLGAPRLATAYASADVLVMPSRSETVGLVLLEAAAAGLPIVAAETQATRHTLRRVPASLVATDAGPGTWVAAVAAALSRRRPSPAPVPSWREVTDGLVATYRSVAGLPPQAGPHPAGTPGRAPFEGSAARTVRRSSVASS